MVKKFIFSKGKTAQSNLHFDGQQSFNTQSENQLGLSIMSNGLNGSLSYLKNSYGNGSLMVRYRMDRYHIIVRFVFEWFVIIMVRYRIVRFLNGSLSYLKNSFCYKLQIKACGVAITNF